MRRLVTQELQLRTVGRRVPPVVMPLLLSGFGPMLAVQFLRGGADCTEWKESIELLEQLLASLQPEAARDSAVEREARQAGIEAAVSTRLISVGIPEPKVQVLLAGLLQAYLDAAEDAFTQEVFNSDEPRVDEQEDVAPRMEQLAQQALNAILTPGGWFKVWDAAQQQQRWLKLTSYYPAQDAVVFSDFLGQNLMKMRGLGLVHDLLEGRSEPVDPDAVVQKSLRLLDPLAARARACEELPVWVAAEPPAAQVTQ